MKQKKYKHVKNMIHIISQILGAVYVSIPKRDGTLFFLGNFIGSIALECICFLNHCKKISRKKIIDQDVPW